MQVILSLPDVDEVEAAGRAEQLLFRKVCGIPLLTRVIATACRSGATEVLLLHPKTLPEARLRAGLNSALFSSVPIRTLALDRAFDPDNPADWQAIDSHVDAKFLWLPWNYVAHKKALSRMIEAGKTSTEGLRFAWSEGSNRRRAKEGDASPEVNPEMPAVIIKDELMNVARSGSSASRSGKESPLRQYLADAPRQEVALARSPGRLLPPEQTVRQVERELVRVSGKETDGFYSNFNRRLCRPTVRWLTKTPITPNMVSFAGLGVVLLSGYWFAQGYWVAYVLGSLLYFLSVLVDEIDGMLARLTFRESAFGCWLETFIDYTSYVVLFAGMTIGLYRESGPLWLAAGGILFFGTFTSFFVVSFQRKLATDPDRPNEYLSRVHRRLEADSGNILSRFGRQAEFLIRRGAFGHYVFLFSLLGGLKVLFLICVFGSNLVWTLALSFNRLFRNPVSEMHLSESGQQFSARVQAEGNDT